MASYQITPKKNCPLPGSSCPECKKKVGARSQAVQCESCNIWQHAKCSGISSEVYRFLRDGHCDYLHFFCTLCYTDGRYSSHRVMGEIADVPQTVLVTPKKHPHTPRKQPQTPLNTPTPTPSLHEALANDVSNLKRQLSVLSEAVNLLSQSSQPKIDALLTTQRDTKRATQPPKRRSTVASQKVNLNPAPQRQVATNSQPHQKPRPQPHNCELKLKPTSNAIICTGVPEGTSHLFQSCNVHDQEQWAHICQILHLAEVKPICLTRLSRPKTSPHADEPRLLRVDLPNGLVVEDVLLASHYLSGDSNSPIRVFADVPWTERTKSRTTNASDLPNGSQPKQSNARPRAVIIHGMAEPYETDSPDQHNHDREQWRYIQQLLKTEHVISTGISRLPRSPRYQGSAPRLVKVKLLTSDMCSEVLQHWYLHRRTAPPDVRIRPDIPKSNPPENVPQNTCKLSSQHQPNTPTDATNTPEVTNDCAEELPSPHSTDSAPCQSTLPKNVLVPVPSGPAPQ